MIRNYGVSMMFACHEGSLNGDIIDYEEQIRLIRSVNREELMKLATSIGHNSELSYPTINGVLVYWKFVGVCSVFEIMDDLTADGAEVFSRHLGIEIVTDPVFQPLPTVDD